MQGQRWAAGKYPKNICALCRSASLDVLFIPGADTRLAQGNNVQALLLEQVPHQHTGCVGTPPVNIQLLETAKGLTKLAVTSPP